MKPPRDTILVVDDDPTNIAVIGAILSTDYQVVFATSGREALLRIKAQHPALVLLDVSMPGMSGYDVCREMHTDEVMKTIPVIFLSAQSRVEDEATGLEAGAVDYVTKPPSPQILRLRVRNHLELRRMRELYRDLCVVDSLTGVANRRRFDEHLTYEWRRARRDRSPLSLIMIDIDNFKPYNDSMGHLAGDSCLRHVGQALASAVRRPSDLISRYGGDEFACTLPATDQAGGTRVAAALKQQVDALGLCQKQSTTGRLTISMGLATALASDFTELEDLMRAADRALYQAKAAGRNRLVVYDWEASQAAS